jgi:hypothetical protein
MVSDLERSEIWIREKPADRRLRVTGGVPYRRPAKKKMAVGEGVGSGEWGVASGE